MDAYLLNESPGPFDVVKVRARFTLFFYLNVFIFLFVRFTGPSPTSPLRVRSARKSARVWWWDIVKC